MPLGGESEERDFTITIQATTGVTAVQTVEDSFILKLKNPCIDTAFVELVVPTVQSTQIDYELYSGSINQYFHVFEFFDVIQNPFDHDLCGSVAFEVTWDGTLVSLISYLE